MVFELHATPALSAAQREINRQLGVDYSVVARFAAAGEAGAPSTLSPVQREINRRLGVADRVVERFGR